MKQFLIGQTIFQKFNFLTEQLWWALHLGRGSRHPWMDDVIDPERRKGQFPQWIQPYIDESECSGRNRVKILDVGCGPISPLAWGVDQNMFDLMAVDPLANTYKAILKRHKIFYPIVPLKGFGENLLEYFEKGSFDIVYSRNALDHATDVPKCISNIHTVLKPGGFACLEGFVREGTKTGWMGLHQHDLFPIKGELVHSNKKGELTHLGSHVGFHFVDQEETGYQVGDWYKITFRK